MQKQFLKALLKIGEALNAADAVWAVGASLMLYQYGLCDSPNDIDIFVKSKDIDKAIKAIDSIGISMQIKNSDNYMSDYYCKYRVDSIDVDVIAGFTIRNNGSTYKYDFSEKSIGEIITFCDVKIPFCSLNDWAKLYSLMPKGKEKAGLIEEYIMQNI